MSLYVKRSSPTCGHTIEGWQHDYRGLGKPYAVCAKSGQVLLVDHVAEWELKNPFWSVLRRRNYISYCHHLWLCPPGPVCACLLLSRIRGQRCAWRNIISGGISSNDGVWFPRTLKDIEDSRKRMKNPKYRSASMALGNLKDDNSTTA